MQIQFHTAKNIFVCFLLDSLGWGGLAIFIYTMSSLLEQRTKGEIAYWCKRNYESFYSELHRVFYCVYFELNFTRPVIRYRKHLTRSDFLLLTFWRVAQMSQSGFHFFSKKSFLFITSALRCEYRKGLHLPAISDHCWPELESTRTADICCPLLEYVSEDSGDDSMWFCFYQMFPFATFLTINGFLVKFLAYWIKNSLLG